VGALPARHQTAGPPAAVTVTATATPPVAAWAAVTVTATATPKPRTAPACAVSWMCRRAAVEELLLLLPLLVAADGADPNEAERTGHPAEQQSHPAERGHGSGADRDRTETDVGGDPRNEPRPLGLRGRGHDCHLT
jgi:hypothetical protein